MSQYGPPGGRDKAKPSGGVPWATKDVNSSSQYAPYGGAQREADPSMFSPREKRFSHGASPSGSRWSEGRPYRGKVGAADGHPNSHSNTKYNPRTCSSHNAPPQRTTSRWAPVKPHNQGPNHSPTTVSRSCEKPAIKQEDNTFGRRNEAYSKPSDQSPPRSYPRHTSDSHDKSSYRSRSGSRWNQEDKSDAQTEKNRRGEYHRGESFERPPSTFNGSPRFRGGPSEVQRGGSSSSASRDYASPRSYHPTSRYAKEERYGHGSDRKRPYEGPPRAHSNLNKYRGGSAAPVPFREQSPKYDIDRGARSSTPNAPKEGFRGPRDPSSTYHTLKRHRFINATDFSLHKGEHGTAPAAVVVDLEKAKRDSEAKSLKKILELRKKSLEKELERIKLESELLFHEACLEVSNHRLEGVVKRIEAHEWRIQMQHSRRDVAQ